MSRAPIHVRVLTSCTGSKVVTTEPLPAEKLYCGQHHVRLMRGVTHARAAGLHVDVAVVSAGHGIIDGDHHVRPYECTFQGLPADARRALARKLGIPRGARETLARPADLHLVLLGEDYLEACDLRGDVRPSAPTLVVCAAGTALRLPPLSDVHPVVVTTEDTRRFRCGLVALKGEIGRRLLIYLADAEPPLDELTGPGILGTLAAMSAPSDVAASTLF